MDAASAPKEVPLLELFKVITDDWPLGVIQSQTGISIPTIRALRNGTTSPNSNTSLKLKDFVNQNLASLKRLGEHITQQAKSDVIASRLMVEDVNPALTQLIKERERRAASLIAETAMKQCEMYEATFSLPECAALWLNCGVAALLDGNAALAEKALQWAAKLAMACSGKRYAALRASIANEQAAMALRNLQPAEAQRHAERALGEDPCFGEALYNLLCAASLLNDKDAFTTAAHRFMNGIAQGRRAGRNADEFHKNTCVLRTALSHDSDLNWARGNCSIVGSLSAFLDTVLD